MIYDRKFRVFFKDGKRTKEIDVTFEINTEKCAGCDIEKVTEKVKKLLSNGADKIEILPLTPKQNQESQSPG